MRTFIAIILFSIVCCCRDGDQSKPIQKLEVNNSRIKISALNTNIKQNNVGSTIKTGMKYLEADSAMIKKGFRDEGSLWERAPGVGIQEHNFRISGNRMLIVDEDTRTGRIYAMYFVRLKIKPKAKGFNSWDKIDTFNADDFEPAPVSDGNSSDGQVLN